MAKYIARVNYFGVISEREVEGHFADRMWCQVNNVWHPLRAATFQEKEEYNWDFLVLEQNET